MANIGQYMAKNSKTWQKITFCHNLTKMSAKLAKFKNCHIFSFLPIFWHLWTKKAKICQNNEKTWFFLYFCLFLLINVKIWVNLQNYCKFWFFVDFALILVDLWQKVICLPFLAISCHILAEIRQHYQILLRISA